MYLPLSWFANASEWFSLLYRHKLMLTLSYLHVISQFYLEEFLFSNANI